MKKLSAVKMAMSAHSLVRGGSSLLCAVLFFSSTSGWAWGRRGHGIIGESAAYLASAEPGADPLKFHSFDIGYYCNVPDFIWKRPATYEIERHEHYMDLEIFEKAFARKPEIKNPYALSREDFEAKFPDVKVSAGRSFWRIRELTDYLNSVAQELRHLPAQTGPERQALQEKWLVTAGLIGHYVGDLSMPLHVTEDHDGQSTGQRGVHSFFEDTCVDQLFPKLQSRVMEDSRKQWSAYQKKNADKQILDLLVRLTADSKSKIKEVLDVDKRNKRENVKVTCAKYEALIVRRMTESTLLLAEVYRRALGWNFDNNKFWFFAGTPDFIPPGPLAPLQSPPVANSRQ